MNQTFRMHSTIVAPIEIACKMGGGWHKAHFLAYKLLLIQIAVVLKFRISDNSSETNIYGHPESSVKMASEVGQ